MTRDEAKMFVTIINEIGGPTNIALAALKDRFPEIGWGRKGGLIQIDTKFKAPAINDGGPAFPHGDETHGGRDGMSVRMWLAGQAMSGMLANALRTRNGRAMTAVEYVEDALLCADALIAESRHGPTNPG